MELGLGSVSTLLLACLVAYFLKGFSGFGPALIFVPTVSILLDPPTALASSAFIDLFVGAALAVAVRYHKGDLRLIVPMVATMSVGTYLGGNLAATIDPRHALGLIGIIVLALGVRLVVVAPPNVAEQSQRHGSVFAGWLYLGCLAGGFSGGLVGISGPYIVAAARSFMDKFAFRRILVAVFLVEGLVKLLVYRSVGIWNAEVFELALLVSPAVVVGLIVGFRSHLFVTERVFGTSVGVVLVLLSARVMWQVVFGG